MQRIVPERIGLLISKSLIVVLSLFIGWLIFHLVVPTLTGSSLGYTKIGDDPLRPNSNRDGYVLSTYFHDFSIGRGETNLDLKLDIHEVSLPARGNSEQQICVDTLTHRNNLIRFSEPYTIDPYFGSPSRRGIRADRSNPIRFTEFCTSAAINQITHYLPGSVDTRIVHGDLEKDIPVSSSSLYYFPFDQRVVDVNIWLTAHVSPTTISTNTAMITQSAEITTIVILPEIVGFISVPDWDETYSISNEYVQQLNHETKRLEIVFRRPLVYRVLTIVLLGSMFTFTLVLAFINDVSGFLQVATGILLGLWGIQDILIPSNISEPTIVEPVIMLLYVMIPIAVFVRFVLRPVWQRLSP